jgi:hypothetical protein
VNTLLILCLVLLGAQDPTNEVVLTSGEVLQGRVVEQTAEVVIFVHPLLGRMEIPASAVKKIRPIQRAQEPDPDRPLVPQIQSEIEPPAPKPKPKPKDAPPPPKPKSRWKSKISVGMNGSAGVSQDFETRLGFNTTYKDTRQNYILQSAYYYDSSRGDKTDNEAYIDFLAAWPFGESGRWSWFVNPRYDFDEFQSWKHRASAGTGLRYLLFDVDRRDEEGNDLDVFQMHVRGGINGQREWGSLEEDLQPELLFGTGITWNISDSQTLAGRATVFPALDDTGEFRTISKLDWNYKLDKWDGLVFTIGLEHEYQSQNDPGIKPNDLKVYATLGVSF